MMPKPWRLKIIRDAHERVLEEKRKEEKEIEDIIASEYAEVKPTKNNLDVEHL